MKNSVFPKSVRGEVRVPSSKSVLQRYIIAAGLAPGMSMLSNVVHCEDTLACLSAIQSLGATVNEGAFLQIHGMDGKPSPTVGEINCGESGFALRALTSVAALSQGETILMGVGSLTGRPMNFFEIVFPALSVNCKTQNGFVPVKIQGPVQFKDLVIDGSMSSQFLSGLLMIFPFAPGDHTIEVKNLKSRNYIDLTIRVLSDFGIAITHDSYQKFFIPGNQHYKACNAEIEGDWSSASFLLVAGAIAGEVKVTNLNMNSSQPDKAITGVLEGCGAEIIIELNSVTARKKNLLAFNFDATDCPDLFPPLVALAACCEGVSVITGVNRLVHKESNRALTLLNEYSKLNNEIISIEGDTMKIRGGLMLKSAEVNSNNDHRIAMALAISALRSQGEIQINLSEAVLKSYPGFFKDIEKLTRQES